MGWRHHCTTEDPAFGQGENQFSLCVEGGSDHLRGRGVHRHSRKQLCCPRGEAREAEQQNPEGSNLQGSWVGATAEITSPGLSPGTFSAAWPCSPQTVWVWAALYQEGRPGIPGTISGCVKHLLDQWFPQAERLKFNLSLLHLDNLNIAEGVREETVNHCEPLVSWVLSVSRTGGIRAQPRENPSVPLPFGASSSELLQHSRSLHNCQGAPGGFRCLQTLKQC